MGSRSNLELAYIAGFLDGDGSLMLQIKKRKDGNIGIRFMHTICFYQDTRHEKELYWIRKVLDIGYLSRRNDGMTELRINGFKQVKKILEMNPDMLRMLVMTTVKENTYLGKKVSVSSSSDGRTDGIIPDSPMTETLPIPDIADRVSTVASSIEDMDKSIDEMVKGA